LYQARGINKGVDVEMDRVKIHFDKETRKIRRVSAKIRNLCVFEENTQAFVSGLLKAIKELSKVKIREKGL